ncbi:MAG: acyltransferase family protein [Acidimicrobiales bacterium]|nr:acyltransferase family protein [Acidimicrobiales bacterium]
MRVESPESGLDTPAPKPAGRRVRAFGGYQSGFDGMRGVCVVFIMLFHAELGPSDGAFFSLSQFFTLSGFLITAILLSEHERDGRIDFKRFFTRRMRRLAPGALMGLVVAVVFGATVATRTQAEQLPGDILGVILYVVNWRFIANEQSYAEIFASPSPVNHYWSLAVEEQFYLIIPVALAFLLARRLGARTNTLIAASVVLASTAWMWWLFDSGAEADRYYYGTDTRLGEVGAGVVLALILNHRGHEYSETARRRLAVVGLAAFAAMAYLWTSISIADAFPYRGGFLINAVLTCTVITVLIAGGSPLSKIYGFEPLAWVGRLSYGIYIFHFPIFLWLTPERLDLGAWPTFAIRVSLTIAVAYLSNRFVEAPIRSGASFGFAPRARVLAYPVAGVALVAATVATANTSGADPLETLRTDDLLASVPVQTADGVLDLAILHTANNQAVVDELFAAADGNDRVRVAYAEVVECRGGVVATDSGETCASWAAAWPPMLTEHDPDTVLWFVDDWAGDEPTALDPDAPAEDTIARLLGGGFDLLSANGAKVVTAQSGASYQANLARAFTAYGQAFGDVGARDDVVEVLSGAIPAPAEAEEVASAADTAAVLLELGALYQRADRSGGTRVMVVGDSQARSLGFGLERWGSANDLWVWNVATNGCGLADEGFKYGTGEEAPLRDECRRVLDDASRRVQSFDPDVVVVFTSVWDLGLRRLADWPEPVVIGHPDFDAYLEREYLAAIDALSAGGAHVVWMQPPCLESGSNEPGGDVSRFSIEEVDRLNSELLPRVAGQRRDAVSLFDLASIVCPDGEPIQEADGVSPIRGDGVHFNVDGSAWFAETYGAEVLALGGV